MPKKLHKPSFNGQTPNVGGRRQSDELSDREVANFIKKKRATKISSRKRGLCTPLPTSEADLAADLELRRHQLRGRHEDLVALGVRLM